MKKTWPLLLCLSAVPVFADALPPTALIPASVNASTVSRQQVVNEYQQFLFSSQGASIDLKITAMSRISALQMAENRLESPNQDPLASDSTQNGLKKNIQLYKEILEKYPQREGNDTVLYLLAEAYDSTLDLTLSIKTLEQLVATYPDSPYVQEVLFRRAEMLFSQMEYKAGAKAYRQVINYGEETPFYTFALYKHGWSLFRQERFEGSIDSFLNVLDSMVKDMSSHNDMLFFAQLKGKERQLFVDTLRVISLSFSYLSDALSITSRLALHSERRNEYLIYGSLGDLYLKKERFYDAAQVLYDFSMRHADHIQAPLFHIRAIDSAKKAGFASLVLEWKLAFVKIYGLDGNFWKEHSQANHPKTVAYLKTSMQQLAFHYHALAQHSKKPDDFQLAVTWYRKYIDSFKADPKTAEMSFTLAEALFENKKFDEAATQYEKVAYDYAQYEKSAEAGYAALMAYQKQEKQGVEGEAWLASAQHFAQTYPDHPETINVLLKVAEGYYALEDWEQVEMAEKSLISRKVGITNKQRLTALTMLGHAQFESARFDVATDTYMQALKLAGTDEKIAILKENVASALYKQGEEARQKDNLLEAANYFQQVRNKVSGTKIQAIADYDAATALFEQREWFKSIMILKTFQQEFPSHRLQKNVPAMLAVAFENLHQPINAAEQFEKASQVANNKDVQKEALWSAAVLYEENNNTAKAMPLYQAYLKRFPEEFYDGMEVRHKLAKFYKKNKDKKRYYAVLKDVVSADHRFKTKRTERSSLIAAQASLALAGVVYTDFLATHLTAPLKENLQRKKAYLETGIQKYGDVLEYGVAETSTAATFYIAQMYLGFSKALLNSERPAGLSADEQEQYTFLLEDQAMPFEDQAIKSYEINAQRLSEGLYDSFIRASLEALAVLMPVRYAKHEISERRVGLVRLKPPQIKSPKTAAQKEQPVDINNGLSVDTYVVAFDEALDLMTKGKENEALRAFQALSQQDSRQIEAYLNVGILFFNGNKTKEAIQWFEKALSVDAKNVIANNFLGILARQQGGFPQAEAYYLKAIQQDKTYQNAHLNLAILYDLYRLAPEKALPHYAEYLTLIGKAKTPVKFWRQDLERRLEQSDKNV